MEHVEIRKKLISPTEQAGAVALMFRFKDAHEQIAALERAIEEIEEKKNLMISDLEMARADDLFFQAQLEATYGPGRLDGSTLEWIMDNETYEQD